MLDSFTMSMILSRNALALNIPYFRTTPNITCTYLSIRHSKKYEYIFWYQDGVIENCFMQYHDYVAHLTLEELWGLDQGAFWWKHLIQNQLMFNNNYEQWTGQKAFCKLYKYKNTYHYQGWELQHTLYIVYNFFLVGEIVCKNLQYFYY